MKEYKIRFMNDREFEALSLINPRYVNTKDDLGFADMITNRIFVRRTGVSFVDQFTTAHEIEEILAKNSEHQDEFNIRHKKGGAARNIVPAILGGIATLFTGPIGGAIVGGLSGAGMGATAAAKHPELGSPVTAGLLGGVTGALGGVGLGTATKGAIAGATAAGKSATTSGFLGRTAGAVKGALGFAPATTTAQTGGKLAPTGIPTGNMVGNIATASNPYLKSGLTATGGYINEAASGIPQVLSSGLATQTLGMQPPITGATPAQAQTSATQTFGGTKIGAEAGLPAGISTTGTGVTTSAGGGELAKQVAKKTIWDKLGETLGLSKGDIMKTALGASIPLLAGSMFGASPTPEPFTPEQSALFNETANMVRQGANVQLNPAQTQAITSQYDTALEQARQNIMDRYKMLRPDSDIENDSNMREAFIELESEFAEKKANALAGAQLGLGAQQTQMLAELANMQIGTLAMKAGISYAESRDFKNMLAQLGFMVSQSGQPIIYTNR